MLGCPGIEPEAVGMYGVELAERSNGAVRRYLGNRDGRSHVGDRPPQCVSGGPGSPRGQAIGDAPERPLRGRHAHPEAFRQLGGPQWAVDPQQTRELFGDAIHDAILIR